MVLTYVWMMSIVGWTDLHRFNDSWPNKVDEPFLISVPLKVLI